MTLPVRHRPGSLPARQFPGFGWGEPIAAEWSPAADTRETDDAYVIEAELPGIKGDDIEMGERERAGVLRRSTRRTGRFEYQALLPADVTES